jgi:maltooligosyltrehalose trehalohydrolase
VATTALAATLGRELVLIAESDLNDPRLVTPGEAGGYGLTGQWSDDFHHAVHAALTGERQGYYEDFGSMETLARTLTQVFFHNGAWSSFRGRSHGRPVDAARTPAFRFLGYQQDHDQIGNRAVGDRLADLVPAGLLRVGAGLVLTAPFTPMLFMGEEWGADTPWQFFTDHTEAWLAKAVSEGRRKEFAAHGWAEQDVPDPQDEQTFLRSRLDWSQVGLPQHADLLAWYRELIALRRSRPELADPWLTRTQVSYDEDARWLVAARGELLIVASLGSVPLRVSLPAAPAAVLAASAPGVVTAASSVTMPATSFAVLAT